MNMWLVDYITDPMDDEAQFQFDGIFTTEKKLLKAYSDIEWIHVSKFQRFSPNAVASSLHFGFKKSNYSRHWSKADYQYNTIETNKRIHA